MKNETIDNGKIQFKQTSSISEPPLSSTLIKKDVIFVDKEMPLLEIARLMRDQHIGDVIVTERKDGALKPVGIITDRDLVVDVLANDKPIETLHARDLMTKSLIFAHESDGIYDVIRLMKENGIGRIPVVDREDSLVGIITAKKILQLLAREFNDLIDFNRKPIKKENVEH